MQSTNYPWRSDLPFQFQRTDSSEGKVAWRDDKMEMPGLEIWNFA